MRARDDRFTRRLLFTTVSLAMVYLRNSCFLSRVYKGDDARGALTLFFCPFRGDEIVTQKLLLIFFEILKIRMRRENKEVQIIYKHRDRYTYI